jgi:hypothetical protein
MVFTFLMAVLASGAASAETHEMTVPSVSAGVVRELQQLTELWRAGALADTEFASAKRLVLNLAGGARQQVSDGDGGRGEIGPKTASAKVYSRSNQTIPYIDTPGGDNIAVVFDTAVWDRSCQPGINGFLGPTPSSRLTVPRGCGGVYRVECHVRWVPDEPLTFGQERHHMLRKNGTVVMTSNFIVSKRVPGWEEYIVSLVDEAKPSEYYELVVEQWSGGNMELVGGSDVGTSCAIHAA